MRFFFLLFVFLLNVNLLSSQEIDLDSLPDEEENIPEILKDVNVNQDPRLVKMLTRHIERNRERKKIDGYRVEIFFSSAMNALELSLNKKVEFLSLYPDHPVHIKYEAPNFKVRVGDFRTKNEAVKLYKEIKDDFPVAFIVEDDIDFPLLKPLHYE